MNKKEYLKSIIDEGINILNNAKNRGCISVDICTDREFLVVQKFDYERWMTKANEFLKKYNYNNCIVKINGSVPYSEIISTKLAMITALYDSFALDENKLENLNLLPKEIKDLFADKYYDSSVFKAFKYVEVTIRNKTGLKDSYGANLVKTSFSSKKGQLCDINLPTGEQVAQMELFSGALCSIKNPESHKFNTYSEQEAIELLHLANYLLRILSNK